MLVVKLKQEATFNTVEQKQIIQFEANDTTQGLHFIDDVYEAVKGADVALPGLKYPNPFLLDLIKNYWLPWPVLLLIHLLFSQYFQLKILLTVVFQNIEKP